MKVTHPIRGRAKEIISAKRKYKVCSLAGIFDSHLLWSHYASGFDGVAIEIDLPDRHHKIKEVDYRGVCAYVNMSECSSEEDAARDILFSKNKEWKYEKEIRILNDSEWYEFNSPVSRVIAGHRMPHALFEVLNITCSSLGIPFKKVGIGDEGLDADDVDPPEQMIPNNVFQRTSGLSRHIR
jgi:hypothetical protein